MSVFEGQIIGEDKFEEVYEYIKSYTLDTLNFYEIGIIPSTGDKLRISKWNMSSPSIEPVSKNGECLGGLVYSEDKLPTLCLKWDDSIAPYSMYINPFDFRYICFIIKEKHFWAVSIFNTERVQKLYKRPVSLANILVGRGVTLVETDIYRTYGEKHRLSQHTAHITMNSNKIVDVLDGIAGGGGNILTQIGL